MTASTAMSNPWRLRTLTDRRNDIAPTAKHHPNIACLASRDLVQQEAGTIHLTVTEDGQIIRSIKFSVADGPTPKWLLPTVERAGRLLALPANWDMQGAPTLDDAAIQTALDVLCMVMDQDSSLPSWTPTRDGGVQLDWHESGIDLEIEVSPTSADGYAVISDSTGRVPEWDGPVNSNLGTLQQVFRERLR
jgi:hypothetical protein